MRELGTLIRCPVCRAACQSLDPLGTSWRCLGNGKSHEFVIDFSAPGGYRLTKVAPRLTLLKGGRGGT